MIIHNQRALFYCVFCRTRVLRSGTGGKEDEKATRGWLFVVPSETDQDYFIMKSKGITISPEMMATVMILPSMVAGSPG